MYHDYEVNMKEELEILTLHEQIAEIREMKWGDRSLCSKSSSDC